MPSLPDQPGNLPPDRATLTGYQPLKEEIVRRQKALPKRLLQIAAFALDKPDEIAFGTVSSIAKNVGVPPSAIIRFAQHFGFDGFVEMQRLFRDRMRERSSEYGERLHSLTHGVDPDDGAGKTLEGFLAAGRQSMESALHSVSPDISRKQRPFSPTARPSTFWPAGGRFRLPAIWPMPSASWVCAVSWRARPWA